MMKNKKGSVQDLLFMGGLILFLALTILFGYTIMSKLDDQFQSHSLVTDKGKEASTKLTGYYPGIIDNVFLFFAIGLGMVTLVLATLIRVHPIFIPFFFIALIFTVFLSGILSNIYQEAAANSELIAYSADLTFVSNILTYLPIIVSVIGIFLMVVMYKLNRNEA